jgi:hypothetical protein
MLNKNIALYERDESGILIPKEVELSLSEKDREDNPELVGQTIAVIPMTRGEIKKLFNKVPKEGEKVSTDSDDDGEVISKYCKNPLFVPAEIPYIKPVLTRAIVRTIFEQSGIVFDDKGTKKVVNDEFGKN